LWVFLSIDAQVFDVREELAYKVYRFKKPGNDILQLIEAVRFAILGK